MRIKVIKISTIIFTLFIALFSLGYVIFNLPLDKVRGFFQVSSIYVSPNITWRQVLCSLIYVIGSIFLSFTAVKYIKKPAWKIFSFIFITTITRVIFVYFYRDITLISDFSLLYESSVNIANGLEHMLVSDSYIGMFPYILGYVISLGGLFKIFGASLVVVQTLNISLSVLTVYAIWKISCIFMSEKAAFISALLYALLPSHIMSCLLPMTDILYLAISLIGMYYFLRFIKTGRLYYSIISSLVLFASNIIRPISIVCVAACIIYYLIFEKITEKIKGVLIFLSIFIAISSLWSFALSFNDNLSNKHSYGWNLYVGLNKEYNGMWNEKDAEYANDLKLSGMPPGDIQHHLFYKALNERVFDANISGQFNFFIKKAFLLTAMDDYLQTYIRKAEPLMFATNLYYFMLAFLMCIGMFLKQDKNLYLFMILLFGFTAIHLVLEVQPRYHFQFLPIYCIVSGRVVSSFLEKLGQSSCKHEKLMI